MKNDININANSSILSLIVDVLDYFCNEYAHGFSEYLHSNVFTESKLEDEYLTKLSTYSELALVFSTFGTFMLADSAHFAFLIDVGMIEPNCSCLSSILLL